MSTTYDAYTEAAAKYFKVRANSVTDTQRLAIQEMHKKYITGANDPVIYKEESDD